MVYTSAVTDLSRVPRLAHIRLLQMIKDGEQPVVRLFLKGGTCEIGFLMGSDSDNVDEPKNQVHIIVDCTQNPLEIKFWKNRHDCHSHPLENICWADTVM